MGRWEQAPACTHSRMIEPNNDGLETTSAGEVTRDVNKLAAGVKRGEGATQDWVMLAGSG